MKTMNETNQIFKEVLEEIARAKKKHGSNNHLPSLDQVLLNRQGSCSPQRMADEYDIGSEEVCKNNCQTAYDRGELTHAHILIEEVSEVIGCLNDEQAMRKKLIQVIAMATNWIISIDSDHSLIP